MTLFFRTYLVIILILFPLFSKANWVDLNTGINDELTGVVFKLDTGLVCGHQGIYYTWTGGSGASSWDRFNISGNSTDSIIYNQTKFNKCYVSPYDITFTRAYFCGEDTVNNKAVLMYLNNDLQSYSIIYYGNSGSALNDISYNSNQDLYYSVGDNGLFLRFTEAGASVVSASISQDIYGVDFAGDDFILAAGEYIYMGLDDGISHNSTLHHFPTQNYVGCMNGSWSYSFVGNEFLWYMNGDFDSSQFYDYAPLNANCIISIGTYYCIGTDHGIYSLAQTVVPFNKFEFSPSTAGYNITDIYRGLMSIGYACGSNGTVLTSTNGGGVHIPYCYWEIDSVTCEGASQIINPLSGSSDSCFFYINDSLVSDQCGTVFYNTVNLNYDSLTFIGKNSAGIDTLTSIVQISDPGAGLGMNILDTVLCRESPLEITLINTNSDEFYILRSYDFPGSFSDTIYGNGGDITFQSYLISESGSFYIYDVSQSSLCSIHAGDTINVLVEYPEVAIHTNRINAEIGETVQFYGNSIEVQNYEWTFTNGASNAVMNIQNPQNQFSMTGLVTTTLKGWTDYGCYDSTGIQSLNIISQPSFDSCWSIYMTGIDESTLPNLLPEFGAICNTTDGGIVTGGRFADSYLGSKFGTGYNFTDEGSYVAKYDKYGVLKWKISAKDPVINNFIGDVYSIKEGPSGSIYFCGISLDYIHDNQGLDVPINSFMNDRFRYIAKADSSGKVLWTISTEIHLTDFEIDINDNVFITGAKSTLSNNGAIIFYRNNLAHDTLNLAAIDTMGNFVFYLDSTQHVNELFGVEIDSYGSVDHTHENFLELDANGNLYFQITALDMLEIKESNSGSNHITSFNNNLEKPVIMKFSNQGDFLWKAYMAVDTVLWEDDAQVNDFIVSPNGSAYLVGKNTIGDTNTTKFQTFHDDSGMILDTIRGQFIAKIGSNGIWEWAQGSENSERSTAERIEWVDGKLAVFSHDNPNSRVVLTSVDGKKVFNDSILGEYIVYYDTLGSLDRVSYGGGSYWPADALFSDFIWDSLSQTYLTVRTNVASNQIKHWNGDIMPNTFTFDGVLTRFTEECGLLTVFPKYYVSYWDTVYLCSGSDYTFPNGDYHNNISQSYTHTSYLSINPTTDSIVYTQINLYPSYQEVDSVFLCPHSSYTFQDGFVIDNIDSNFIYTTNSLSQDGCDSSYSTVITLNNVDINLQIDGDSIFSNAPGASFQWLNCDSLFYPIQGETNSLLVTNGLGSYALQISQNGCVDTSNCTMPGSLSTFNQSIKEKINIFPNPSKGIVYFQSNFENEKYEISVLSAEGSLIERKTIGSFETITLPSENGVYIIQVRKDSMYRWFRIIKI